MHAAIVHGQGQTPQFDTIAPPVAAQGEVLVTVAASALNQLTRVRAAGTHYSSGGQFPLIAGVDGTGTIASGPETGKPVYFLLPRAPFGAMAETTVVPRDHCLPLPDGCDPVTAAAIANPGMSSWAALIERAHLRAGETVLVNGATGASGQLAVRIARHLGASRVIATGRNRAMLASLGADVILPLDDEPAFGATLAREFAQGIDVVVDYLWGPSAEQILITGAKAAPEGRAIRFVQIGTASGLDIRLPGAVLRSSGIELMGSGLGSVPLARLLAAIDGVLQASDSAGLALATKVLPLAQVTEAWGDNDGSRIVLTP